MDNRRSFSKSKSDEEVNLIRFGDYPDDNAISKKVGERTPIITGGLISHDYTFDPIPYNFRQFDSQTNHIPVPYFATVH